MINVYTVLVYGHGVWLDVTEEELIEAKNNGLEYSILFSGRKPKYEE